eukprot:3050166-Pyramimonas_sp.AAC.2
MWKERLSVDTQHKDNDLESLKRAQQRDKDRLDTLVESTQKEQAEKELRANEERRAMQEENRHLNDRERCVSTANATAMPTNRFPRCFLTATN